ncbi:TerD family protein [Lysinibacillus odysseyi]|uniref:Chemical-damaging agent resistance protein C n=1 Tax=Lysinibacillus odysseyi 34hs-1 = NBRC 100172 TaxID=1220589 RepID=A0A0A3ILV7_9BACI|nr:TerD family protein [Lysinibacillus odysseyi]KGR85756.1 chemical-damaging agent resistance protein C [Lysinibacillus odysseyi 34hs-1 = NBRC 100172]
MVVSLAKGQKVDLTKTNPGLQKVMIGLGWDTNKYDGGHDFDLDTSIFLLDETGKVKDPSDFVFYNNTTGGNGSVVHSGDNLTGDGDGDDEVVYVTLNEVPAAIQKITFTVTIHDAESRNQNFGMVSNAFIRIVNDANGQELIRYDLGEDFSIETALVVGELYRHGAEWKFSAIGSGYQGGLAALCNDFGLQVG